MMTNILSKLFTGNGRNSQYMKINVADLVIDLPVDESHVLELMESIKLFGRLTEPPTIWLEGRRIINGFHRIDACKRLGIEEIDCIVSDIGEEEFWDSRISAAKPHAKISDERFGTWMLEAWALSHWYKLINLTWLKREFQRYGMENAMPKTELEFKKLSLAFQLRQMSFNGNYSASPSTSAISAEGRLFYSSEKEIEESNRIAREAWFVEKATKWGVHIHDIQRVMFKFLGVEFSYSISAFDTVSALALAKQAKAVSGLSHPERLRQESEWVSSVRSGETGSLSKHVEKNKKEIVAREDATKFKKTEQGKAAELKKKSAILLEDIEKIRTFVKLAGIDGVPNAPAMLVGLIDYIEQRINQVFPGYLNESRVGPVFKENIQLKRKVEEQEGKIQSLEKELRHKQSAMRRFPEVRAVSSSEVEAMA